MAQVKGTLWFGTNVDDGAVKALKDIRSKIDAELETPINVKVNVQGIADLGTNSGNAKAKIDELTNSMTSNNSVVAESIRLYTQLNEQMQKLVQQRKDAGRAGRDVNSQGREDIEIGRRRNSIWARLNSNMNASIGISGALTDKLLGMYSVFKAKEFLDNVIAIGGQLEQQRVSIAAILHNASHADELFGKIKSLAIQSPFGVLDLDKYTKQLSAYGFQYNELFDMTKRLADISAGAGTDISRLALALGHVRSATYLTGITLRQFSMNNIPMLKMLSEYYSQLEKRIVTTAEVQKRIFNREVGYEAVINVIKRMTDEGGQFYNMQAVMADTLAGKWKNLKDAVDLMYGEIGESSVGAGLKNVAQFLTDLTKKWRQLIPIITSATVTLGAWRASVLLSSIGVTSWRVGMEKLVGSMGALRGMLATMGPWLAAFAGLAAVTSAWQHYTRQIEEADKATENAFKKGAEGVKNLNKAISQLKNPAETMTNDAYTQGIKGMEQYLKDYSIRAAEIINEANRVDEHGDHIYTLAERYKYLYEQMQVTLEVYKELKRTADNAGKAMGDTGGFLNDNVNTDLMDYANERKKWNASVEKLYSANMMFIQEYIDKARQEDAAFANTTKNMTNYADVLKLIIQRQEDFSRIYEGLEDELPVYFIALSQGWESVNTQFGEAKSEVDKWIASMKESFNSDWSTPTDKNPLEHLSQEHMDVIRHNIRDFLNSEELAGLSDFDRQYFNKYIHSQFNIDVVTNVLDAETQLMGWQKEMQDYFKAHGISIPVGPEDTPETIAKKAKELRDTYQNQIDSSGKVLIGIGFKLDQLPQEKPSYLTPWGGFNFDLNKDSKKGIDAVNKAIEHFNLNVEEANKKSKKTSSGSKGGVKKDTVLEQWRQRVQSLKDFYSEWNALRKELGRSGAYQEILKSGLMPDMFDENGKPKYNLDNYAEELAKMNAALDGTTDARKKAKQALKKDQFKEIRSNTKESAEAIMAELKRSMEEASRKWDLYKTIADKTGDKSNAMQLVFGNTENLRKGIQTAQDYWKSMLESVAEGVTAEDLAKMSDTQLADKFGENWKKVELYRDEYLKAFKKSADEEEKIYLDLLEASMTYADKMAAIEAKRQREVAAAKGDQNLIYAANKRAQESTAQLNLDKMKSEINWDVVFGNLDTYTKDVLVKVRKQLKEFMRLNKKGMDVKQIKDVQEAIAKLDKEIANQSGLFGGVRDAMTELKNAEDDLTEAQNEYDDTVKQYTEDSQQAADALEKLNAAQGRFLTAQGNLQNAKNTAVDNFTAISNSITALGKNSEATLSDVGNAVGSVIGALGKSGSKYGQLISAIFSLLDALGNDSQGFFENIFKGIGNGIYGLNSSLNLVGNIYKDYHKNHKIFGDNWFNDQMVDMYTMDWMKSADYSEYEKAKEQYENLVSVWDTLIDRKKEYLNESWGTEAVDAAREAADLLQARIESTRVIADERLGAGTSTWSHSIGYRMWEGSYQYEGQNWKDVAQQAVKEMKAAGLGDVKFTGMTDMLNMTKDQLLYLMKNYSGLWAEMDGDFREYLEKLIGYYDEAEEMTEDLKEKLTGWNFSSLSDSWASTLADMSNSADNMLDDFENNLREAILNAMISNIYGEEIEKLVDGVAEAAKNELYTNVYGETKKHTYDSQGNILDSDVLSEYTQDEYSAMKLVAENLAEREAASRDLLADIYGWESENGGASSSATQVLSGLTEDDQGLLMSYINAIRADVSIQRSLVERITLQIETGLPSVGQNLAETTTLLRSIESNTGRSATNTELIETFCRKIENGEVVLRVK